MVNIWLIDGQCMVNGFPRNGGIPIAGLFIMDLMDNISINVDDLGLPLF